LLESTLTSYDSSVAFETFFSKIWADTMLSVEAFSTLSSVDAAAF